MTAKNIVLFILVFFTVTDAQNLYINEFMASNVSTHADLFDYDDFSDWIELYNDSDQQIYIGGFFLSDDPGDPYRWSIPQGTRIEAKGYLLLWADGNDDRPGITYTRDYYPNGSFTTRYNHSNFKLDRAGEWLGLTASDSTILDSVSYNLQFPDISYGRQFDGMGDFIFHTQATPGLPNDSTAVTIFQESETAKIDLPSGFYDQIQNAGISALAQNALVTYTVDGSNPHLSSMRYSEPIEITNTMILKIRVFEPGKLPGKVITRSYFINENVSLPVISLSVDPQFFWDDDIGIYENTLKQREVPVNFEIFDSLGNSEYQIDTGLSLTGQASVWYDQKSFTISARDRFGSDAFNYQFFPTRKQNIFKDIYLRNAGFPDHRNTIFRDALQATIIGKKMDLDYQAYLPYVVFINGAYWGIYNLRDKINANQLAIINNINPDDVDLLEYEGSSMPIEMNGNTDNFDEMYNYIQNADLSVEEQYQVVTNWIDIDEYINYQIAEIYYDNTNAVEQNVRMWRERKDNRKWRWILYDMDYAFGMPNQRSSGYTNNTLEFATSSNSKQDYVPPLWSTLIFRKLLENESFRNTFIQRFAGYINTVFHPDTVLNIIDSLQNRLYPEMNNNILRWRNGEFYYGYPIQNIGEWIENVNVMKDFARFRPAYQRNHIRDYFNLGDMVELRLSIAHEKSGHVIINEVAETGSRHNGLYFNGVPIELKAVPAVGYTFLKWLGLNDSLNSEVTFIPQADSLGITAVFTKNNNTILPQSVRGDTTLTAVHSPYYARDHLYVNAGAQLTLEEGVKIFMPEGKSIVINGTLSINGIADNPVTIQPNNYSSSWGALCFVNARDTSVITHLTISGATKGINFSRDKAAVSAYNSHLVLNNVITENVLNPVFVQYGSVRIYDCRLSAGTAGDLINVKQASSALIEKCDLQGNEFFDSDAIDFDNLANGVIRKNHIYNFGGFNSDAIDLGEGAADILIEGNVIYNINDKGVSIGGASTGTARRNIIANCGQGAGIKDYGSYGYFEHNTFYANQVAVASFVKNTGAGGGSADVVNCIIADSKASAFFVDQSSSLNVSYSLCNTDELPGQNNVFGEPYFLNDLYLSEKSAAINSGDPALPSDPDGSTADIGAYPFDPDQQSNLLINEIHYNPSMGEDFEFFELINNGPSDIDLNGYRISGDVQHTFGDLVLESGDFLVMAKNSVHFSSEEYPVEQWYNGTLTDGAGSLFIYDAQDQLVDFVQYDIKSGWPPDANVTGQSLELINPALENMVSTNWRMSNHIGGSPGIANNAATVNAIFINELMASNVANNTDENGEYDDWIEIYNASDNAINLAGLYLADKKDNLLKFNISNGEESVVPAKGFILFWADEQGSQGSRHTNFKLDKEGEWIGLVQITPNDTIIIDSVLFAEQESDVSYGRLSDGAPYWQKLTSPTPMDNNIGDDYEPVPLSFSLDQNYPNPFNQITTIPYKVESGNKLNVTITIFNILGQKVAVLLDEKLPEGSYKAVWDAAEYATGLYFIQLKRGNNIVKTRKMILLK